MIKNIVRENDEKHMSGIFNHCGLQRRIPHRFASINFILRYTQTQT
jgi:hypothetical protein